MGVPTPGITAERRVMSPGSEGVGPTFWALWRVMWGMGYDPGGLGEAYGDPPDRTYIYGLQLGSIVYCLLSIVIRLTANGACTGGGTNIESESAPSPWYHLDTWLVRHDEIPGRKRCVQLANGVG